MISTFNCNYDLVQKQHSWKVHSLRSRDGEDWHFSLFVFFVFFPPSTVHNIIKHSGNLEKFQGLKGEGISLDWSPMISDPSHWHCIKNCYSSIADIKNRQLTTVENLCNALCYRVIFTKKRSLMLTFSSVSINFSGVRGIWDGSHGGNGYCKVCKDPDC